MTQDIQETELYKQFKKALNINNDMRPGPNPFVVECCQIATQYATQARSESELLLREVAMRNQLFFPETKQDDEWFESGWDKVSPQTLTNIYKLLGLGEFSKHLIPSPPKEGGEGK